MIDKLDEEIIAILRLDARESIASIARELKTSRSTVQDRLRRLEDNQTIKGYSVDLDSALGENRIRAFVTVAVEPQKTAMIVSELKTMNPVNAVHSVSGKYDLHVEMGTADTSEMDRTIDRLTEIPGVLRTETSIVLSTKLQR